MKLSKLLTQTQAKGAKAISTGLKSLDQMIGGLHPGHLYTIAGRPAMGCSALTITLARNISIYNKVPTAFFSLDLPEESIVKRLHAAGYGWDSISHEKNTSLDIQIGEGQNYFCPIQHKEQILDKEMERAQALMKNNGWDTDLEKTSKQSQNNYFQMMKEAPLWIEHNLDFTVDEILCRIERMKKNDNIQVVIIDGLWWLIASKTFEERDLIMQNIAQTAKKLNIAILLTTAVNRSVETRCGDKKPMLSDIRGGLCSEVYSSVIMLLYRAEYYGIEYDYDEKPTREMLDVIVAKNAFGERGEIRLRFRGTASIEECVPSSIENDLELLSNKLKNIDESDLPF